MSAPPQYYNPQGALPPSPLPPSPSPPPPPSPPSPPAAPLPWFLTQRGWANVWPTQPSRSSTWPSEPREQHGEWGEWSEWWSEWGGQLAEWSERLAERLAQQPMVLTLLLLLAIFGCGCCCARLPLPRSLHACCDGLLGRCSACCTRCCRRGRRDPFLPLVEGGRGVDGSTSWLPWHGGGGRRGPSSARRWSGGGAEVAQAMRREAREGGHHDYDRNRSPSRSPGRGRGEVWSPGRSNRSEPARGGDLLSWEKESGNSWMRWLTSTFSSTREGGGHHDYDRSAGRSDRSPAARGDLRQSHRVADMPRSPGHHDYDRSRSPGRSRGGQSHLVADVPLATRPARLPEARKPGLAPAREARGGGTAAAVGEHGRGRGLQRGLQTSCGLQTSRSLNLQASANPNPNPNPNPKPKPSLNPNLQMRTDVPFVDDAADEALRRYPPTA